MVGGTWPAGSLVGLITRLRTEQWKNGEFLSHQYQDFLFKLSIWVLGPAGRCFYIVRVESVAIYEYTEWCRGSRIK